MTPQEGIEQQARREPWRQAFAALWNRLVCFQERALRKTAGKHRRPDAAETPAQGSPDFVFGDGESARPAREANSHGNGDAAIGNLSNPAFYELGVMKEGRLLLRHLAVVIFDAESVYVTEAGQFLVTCSFKSL